LPKNVKHSQAQYTTQLQYFVSMRSSVDPLTISKGADSQNLEFFNIENLRKKILMNFLLHLKTSLSMVNTIKCLVHFSPACSHVQSEKLRMAILDAAQSLLTPILASSDKKRGGHFREPPLFLSNFNGRGERI